MSCVARLVLTLESEQVPLPAAQAERQATPAGRAALEAAVRDRVRDALGADPRVPLRLVTGLGERDVVEPERPRALEPDLQPAGRGRYVVLALKEELEPLPARAGRERLPNPEPTQSRVLTRATSTPPALRLAAFAQNVSLYRWPRRTPTLPT